MKYGKKNILGFSLVEMVIVVSLLAVVVAGMSQLLSVGFGSYSMGKNIISADWQGQVAMDRITRDLHLVRSKQDISVANRTNFSFINLDGNLISYQLSQNQLTRNTKVLADGVESLDFQYFDAGGADLGTSPIVTNIRYIVITLNINYGNANYNATTAVYPWNLK